MGRKRFFLPLFVLVVARSLLADEHRRLDLEECFALALKQSESVAADEAAVKAAEARYRQAISAVSPQLNFTASQLLRDGSSTSRVSEFQRTSNTSRFDTAFQVSHPLFNGFREWYEARSAKREMVATSFDTERSRQLLFGSVAQLYLQTILYREDVRESTEIIGVLRSRTAELDKWRNLGRSRESELLEAQSDLLSTRALVEQLKGLQAASKEALSFYIGLPSSDFELLEPSPHPALPQLALPPLSEALSQGERPDISAAEERVAAQRALVTAREREYWPAFTLEGNVYPYESPSSSQDWDVMLRMSVPIFEGGRIESRIAEERALVERNQLLAEELRRRQRAEFQKALAEATAADRESAVLKDLVAVTKATLNSQRQDYELGIVTNLQVMEAIRQLLDAKRRLLAARFNGQLKRVELAVALGVRPQ